jgi:hypothetical protein
MSGLSAASADVADRIEEPRLLGTTTGTAGGSADRPPASTEVPASVWPVGAGSSVISTAYERE